MTREEEIIRAAENNIDIGNFTSEDGKLLRECFMVGAEWADENPINIWHDANEEPEHNCTIAYATKNNKIGTLKRVDKTTWSWYKEKYSILMWAYVADLLPKGGKL